MPETVEPPNALASISPISSGADQAGVRLYNERLILTLVRRFDRLSKIEVARMTGLSVQSASAIMNRLHADGLLRREAPQRGRVGQPTVPFSVDPEGALSLGLKIGRRSCDLVLIDFRGAVRSRARKTFAYPTPELVLDFVAEALPPVIGSMTPAQRRRIAGGGVGAAGQIW
jgi:predicted DNA-binding transcriptional regulator